MIECEVFFHKDDPLGLKHQKRNGKPLVLEQESVHCFVLAREHALHLHTEKEAYDPFYKINPLTIHTEIDPKTNTLTIKRRKKEEIIIKIKSSRDNIERIADFCEENSDEEKLYHPLYYTPCDQHRESYLSVPHKLSKYRGFLNFFLVTAIFSRIRDLVENVSTYGILPPQTMTFPKAEEILSGPIVICTSTIWMFIVEKLAFKGIFPKPLVHILEILNIGAAFGYSIYFILHFEPNPLFGLVYLTWTTMMLLKMISYVHVMSEVRVMLPKIKSDLNKTWKENEKRAFEASKENIDVIKRNLKNPSKIINVKDILYFYHCPTLSYQLWYPRTPKIRWNLLGKWFLQFIPTWVFFAFWYNQFIIPAMNESGKSFKYGTAADRIKTVITVGNDFATLLPSFFYGTFHLLTNIIAEFLRFGDREFYKDFWNCRSIGQFWVSWNLPVHTWCKRHIYYPLIKRGFSKSFSGGVVFLFSGGVHEYLFGLPLRVFGSTAIVGLFLQAPIIAIERKYDHYLRKSQVGNFIFWILTWFLLCPYGVTHYYASYLIKYNYV